MAALGYAAGGADPAAAAQSDAVLIQGHPVHPTRLLARLKSGVATKAQASTLAAQGLKTLRTSTLVPNLVVIDEDSDASVSALSTSASRSASSTDSATQSARLLARIAALRATGLYEYVEPDYIVHALATPTDSRFVDGTLWGLYNYGQSGGVSGVDIDAVDAWDITTGSSSVIVAVIDTGVYYNHVDLNAQMWVNTAETAGNSRDDDGNGYVDDIYGINAISGSGTPIDTEGHGTHVSGTIGAAANDGHMSVGVAWNVQIMACKFLDSDGEGTTSDAITCFEYAAEQGARIFNCSWGDYSNSTALAEAILAVREQGVLVVAAAGNETIDNDDTPLYPASYRYDNVISVAAVNRSGRLASFSNYGASTVDVGAPGVDIFSTYGPSSTSYSTADGTSMATPHVSGVAALVISQYPSILVADLKDRIVKTTNALSSLSSKTVSGGMVSAYNALTATGDGQLEVSLTPVTGATLLAGREQTIVARVTDLTGVTGATVTATLSTGATLTLLDDGVAPDDIADDGNYSASFTVPAAPGPVTISVVAAASGMTGASASGSYPIVQPATNDMFADRIPLHFDNGTVHTTNLGASGETGEPEHTGSEGGTSLWWTWTAPASFSMQINTTGSDFDTMLAVYTGSSVSALTEIASNDDIDGVASSPSRVTFTATAGTTYQIVVDGWAGDVGDVTLNLVSSRSCRNDAFSDRITLTGTEACVIGSNADASLETSEPSPPYVSAARSIWWSWTPSSDCTAVLEATGDDFDAYLEVYQGSSVSALTRVPGRLSEDGASGTQYGTATIHATAGVAYAIAATNAASESGGAITLTLETQTAPDNDLYANRTALSGTTGSTAVDNTWATFDADTPDTNDSVAGASLWWSWTAPADGTVSFATSTSTFDTTVAVFTGTSLADLTLVGTAYGAAEDGATVAFAASSGTTYVIMVDGLISEPVGTCDLEWALVSPPSNDDFADRVTLSGAEVDTDGTNLYATLETDEPDGGIADVGASVWWSWTAPATGWCQMATAGSDFDTVLAVFTGSSLDSLVTVVSNDDDPDADDGSSYTLFEVTAGTTYAISVGGRGGASGAIHLALDTAEALSAAVETSTTSLVAGGSITLSAVVTGDDSGVTYQWLCNGVAIEGATSDTYTVASFQTYNDGDYSVQITSGWVTTESEAVSVAAATPEASGAHLMNISTRAVCLTGNNVLIPGFVVGGTGTKHLLIRAVGPELSTYGITGPISDPQIKLYQSSTLIASNDNWGGNSDPDAVAAAAASVSAFALDSGSTSAAMLADLEPGAYTAVASGVDSVTGVAIVEVYDLDASSSTARLDNISTRGYVDVGERIMIPGFVVSDEGSRTFLVRAVGPGLTAFGLDDVLADPILRIYRGSTKILTNDNWGENGDAEDVAATASAIGAFALDEGSADAAFVVTLPPGTYTVHATGVGNTTGVAIVEVYLVPE